jgi:hypothetical protein
LPTVANPPQDAIPPHKEPAIPLSCRAPASVGNACTVAEKRRPAIVNVDFVREIHRKGRTEGWALPANGDCPRMSAAGAC